MRESEAEDTHLAGMVVLDPEATLPVGTVCHQDGTSGTTEETEIMIVVEGLIEVSANFCNFNFLGECYLVLLKCWWFRRTGTGPG